VREARLRLDKQRVESGAKVDRIERDLAMAKLELENARHFQKKDEVIFSRHEIVESDIDQELAEEKSEHAEGSRRTEEQLARTDDALLQIKIRQAEAKIAMARQGLQALTVMAPHDGVLILKRNWRGRRVGDQVWNGQPLAEIPDLGRCRRRSSSWRPMPEVETGAEAKVVSVGSRRTFGATSRVDAWPGRASRVRRCSTSPSPWANGPIRP
jgi:hypothetical protein